MKRKTVVGFGLTALFGGLFLVPDFVNISDASAGNVVVICNKEVPDDVLAKEELKKMFIGKQKFWDNDMKVVLATLNKSDTHDTFLKKYIKKNSSQYRRYWINLSFTGKGVATLCITARHGEVHIGTVDGPTSLIAGEGTHDQRGRRTTLIGRFQPGVEVLGSATGVFNEDVEIQITTVIRYRRTGVISQVDSDIGHGAIDGDVSDVAVVVRFGNRYPHGAGRR